MENEGIELLRRRGALKVLEQMLRDMTLSVLGELRADRKQSDAFVEKLESYMWGEVRAAKEEHLRQPQSLEAHHQRMGTYLVETEATELLRVDERGKGEDNASPLSLAPTTHKDLASKISVTVERAQPRGALSPHEWKKRNSSGFFEATRLSRADSSSMRAGPGKPAAAVQSEFSFRPKQSVKISSTRRSVDSWIPVRESPGPGEYVARSSLGNMGGKFGKEQKRYDWVLRGSGAEMAYNPSKHYVS